MRSISTALGTPRRLNTYMLIRPAKLLRSNLPAGSPKSYGVVVQELISGGRLLIPLRRRSSTATLDTRPSAVVWQRSRQVLNLWPYEFHMAALQQERPDVQKVDSERMRELLKIRLGEYHIVR